MEINVLISKDDEGRYTLIMVVTHDGDSSDTIMKLKADYVQQDGNIITTI